jgi:hypothetical protein
LGNTGCVEDVRQHGVVVQFEEEEA